MLWHQAFLSQLTAKVLDSWCDVCVWYLDDICVFGNDVEAHSTNLKRVNAKLDEDRLALNYAKCEMKQSSVEFPECRISGQGTLPLEYKVGAVEHCL